MTFATPHAFWLLVLPLVLMAWDRAHSRREGAVTFPRILRAEAGRSRVRLWPRRDSRFGRARPRVLLAIGIAFGIAALARPQWGQTEEQVFDQSREIMIAVDLSRSMLVSDIKPSRLERSKLLVQSLLERLQGERVGMLLFAGTAFVQSPLSADYEILREFLPLLGPRYLPEGGSDYARMLDAAIESFTADAGADRYLVVLSDGDATDDEWRTRLDGLRARQIRVIGLGVGTAEGGLVPDGGGAFVKDERGAVVLSRLGSETMQELAAETGGAYRDSSAWVDLATLLQETVATGQQSSFAEELQVRRIERFQWALALALFFLLLSLWREFPVRPRPRELKLDSAEHGVSALSLALAAGMAMMAPQARAVEADDLEVVAAPLSMVVTRLSDQEVRSAQDWADMARTTVSWGQQVRALGQQVQEGPVRDALAAVALGEALDGAAADWPTLRQELRDLLENPDEEQDQQQEEEQPPPQDQDGGGEESSPESQENSESGESEQSQQSSESSEGGDNQQDSEQQQQGDQALNQPDSSQDESDNPPPADMEQAFSEYDEFLNQQDDIPPPPEESQKVGGTPPRQNLQQADPSLTMTLQRLDQLREQDSPATLYQRIDQIENPNRPRNERDW
jgi:Ca-activated chloride channel family protein